ncbi:cold-shock DNA-binding domain protein [mine drainage metagenome]|uniref:Cold-shock DNA-binding domain protein n=1 Tax=mine drainage metagenome TaxID=410659 RepID=A0A1J5TAE5_9ZZZZ
MRYQGKVTNWKDDQGFGFVVPNGGGQKAFVHIKAFSNRSSRPNNGDLITYEFATDEKGRCYAKNIRFVGERLTARSTSRPNALNQSNSFGTHFAVLFCIFLVFSVFIGRIPLVLLGVYLGVSVVTFLTYAIDKSAAQNNRWRIKERTLHLFSLLGGWPGALVAQKTLRHKSKKEAFQAVFLAMVVINCFTLGWLLITKKGAIFLSAILG